MYDEIQWQIPYPVLGEDFEARGVGFDPLLFDVVEHVNKKGAVHLVCQFDRRVTLQEDTRKGYSYT